MGLRRVGIRFCPESLWNTEVWDLQTGEMIVYIRALEFGLDIQHRGAFAGLLFSDGRQEPVEVEILGCIALDGGSYSRPVPNRSVTP